MNRRNYQKELEEIIADHQSRGEVPSLLLHSCCAPCSSYVLAYLSEYFRITVLYYNPNIYPPEEYRHRAREQQRFLQEFPMRYKAAFIEGPYDTGRFYEMAKGMENLPEGGPRCSACYELRLREAAGCAKRAGTDYFTTTLSISPLKDAQKLNEIGARLAKESLIYILILKRKTAIFVRHRLQKNMECTDRTTADVFFHCRKGRRS